MSYHPKAYVEPNAPGRKTGMAMEAHDVVLVHNNDRTWFGLYIDGQLVEQGAKISHDVFMRYLGGEERCQDELAFEEADSRFPPRLIEIEWDATVQTGPVIMRNVTRS
jgi:hypothetical protein